jgi:hypothetical protein
MNYIQSLEAKINALTAIPTREPKVANPEKFTGRMSDAKNFVATCRDIFALQPSRFTNETQKIIFVGTNLTGNALTWYRNIRLEHESASNPGLSDVESFFRLLLYTFDDPNAVNNSRDQLSRIKQGRESCLSYSTRFRNIAIETGYNEVAKVALYRNGLNETIKDALANMQTLPEKFEDFVKLAINLDNRQFQRRVEHQRENPKRYEPMHIDTVSAGAARKGPLDLATKEYRKKNGLCLYCGERGHQLKDCTKKPKNGPPRQSLGNN